MTSLSFSVLAAASVAWAVICAPCTAQTVVGGSAAPLAVTATVGSVCDIGGGSSELLPAATGDFGFQAALDRRADREITLTLATNLSIRCTADVTPTVVFDYGLSPEGTQRRLRGPGNAHIPYELRRGAASAPLWDDSPYPVSLIPGHTDILPIFGRIVSLPSGLPDGAYADEVQVILSY